MSLRSKSIVQLMDLYVDYFRQGLSQKEIKEIFQREGIHEHKIKEVVKSISRLDLLRGIDSPHSKSGFGTKTTSFNAGKLVGIVILTFSIVSLILVLTGITNVGFIWVPGVGILGGIALTSRNKESYFKRKFDR